MVHSGQVSVETLEIAALSRSESFCMISSWPGAGAEVTGQQVELVPCVQMSSRGFDELYNDVGTHLVASGTSSGRDESEGRWSEVENEARSATALASRDATLIRLHGSS